MTELGWESVQPGSIVVMHPRDYGELLGLRRTRSGQWSWRGRRWRTRALALRRFPPQVIMEGVFTVKMDPHGAVKAGTALVLPPFGDILGLFNSFTGPMGAA